MRKSGQRIGPATGRMPEGLGTWRDGVWFLEPRDAFDLMRRGLALLVDVREAHHLGGKRFAIPDVVSFPGSGFGRALEVAALPRDRLLILADNVGHTTAGLIVALRRRGFDSLASLVGGLLEWERDGLPVAVAADELLTGGCACKLKPVGRLRQARASARKALAD